MRWRWEKPSRSSSACANGGNTSTRPGLRWANDGWIGVCLGSVCSLWMMPIGSSTRLVMAASRKWPGCAARRSRAAHPGHFREAAMTSLVLDPIGIIHSEHTDPRQTPIQPSFAQRSPGRVEVFPPFAQALDDLDGFSHLHLIYWLHRAADVAASMAGSSPLKVVPFLDDVPRGVFATRAPVRPNPLGMSVVRLVERRGSDLLVA